MSHIETVSESKLGRGSGSSRTLPAIGTRARYLYDILYAERGRAISLPLEFTSNRRGRGRALDDLMDFYGCDIRNLRRGVWIFAGEWVGSNYLDYVNEAINEALK